ncbi:MAG: PH domain-containing protein [Canibacter sp.]
MSTADPDATHDDRSFEQQRVEQRANAALPGKADSEGWRTLHPLSPLMRGGLTLLIVFGVIIANMRDQLVYLFIDRTDIGGENSYNGGEEYGIEMLLRFGWVAVAGAILAVVGLVVLFSWISWRFTRFRVADGNVELRQGVLSRKQRRAPLTRIQGVNVQRPLLARILGLSVVDVQTADASGNVKLAYLSYKDAKSVRATLLQTAHVVQRGTPAASPPETTDTAVDETSTSSLIEEDAVLGAHPSGAPHGPPQSGFEQQLNDRVSEFLDTDIDAEALRKQSLVRVPAGRLIASTVTSTSSLVIAAGITAFIVLSIVMKQPAILTGVVPWIIIFFSMTLNNINKGWGFTFSPASGSVRIGSGLTSTTTDTVPLRRIHAIEVSQPILWRPFGWWRVRITTPGLDPSGSNVNTQRSEALPVGKADDVVRVVLTILPGLVDPEALQNDMQSRREGWITAVRRSWPLTLWAVRRVGTRMSIGTEEGEAGHSLLLRGGILSRRISIIPVLRMQSVSIAYPLWHRVLGLARVDVHTVIGFHLSNVRGLNDQVAREIFTHVSGEIVRAQREDAENRYNARVAGTRSAREKSAPPHAESPPYDTY